MNYPFAGRDDVERLRAQAAIVSPPTRHLLARLPLAHVQQAVEIGAGGGDAAILLRQQLHPAARVVAIDVSIAAVASCRSRNASALGCVGRFEQLPLRGSVDLLFGRFITPYVPQFAAALASAVQRVRPGGTIAFIEWDYQYGGAIDLPSAVAFPASQRWVLDTLASSGVDLNIGARLVEGFRTSLLTPMLLRAPLRFAPSASKATGLATYVVQTVEHLSATTHRPLPLGYTPNELLTTLAHEFMTATVELNALIAVWATVPIPDSS